MTWKRMKAENEKFLKEQGLDVDKTYEERDVAVNRLEEQFLERVGLGQEVEYEEVNEGGEPAGKGWALGMWEEATIVWKDGKKLGVCFISCRGVRYKAEMEVGDKKWQADEQTNCWQEV